MNSLEDKITAWFASQSRLSACDFPIGIGDDMAQVRLAEGVSVLITTDMLLDGVHFDLRKVSLEQAGYKAMAVSLSDCAAMATEPVGAVVSVGLPAGFGTGQLKQLHSGIVAAGEKYRCALIGGDITSWKGQGRFVINVAMLSRPAAGGPIRRNGAKAGDAVCVTGTLGGAGLGKHLQFEPRVTEAMKIAAMVKVNSMIDISDGLSSDMQRICRQSKVGAILYEKQIPVSEAALKTGEPLDSALNDGEDFELLFTLSQDQFTRLLRQWSGKVDISRIGTVTDSGKMQIEGEDERVRDLQTKGYDHLK